MLFLFHHPYNKEEQNWKTCLIVVDHVVVIVGSVVKEKEATAKTIIANGFIIYCCKGKEISFSGSPAILVTAESVPLGLL